MPGRGFCNVPGVGKGCVVFLCSVSQKSQAGRGQQEHKFLQWVKKVPDSCLLRAATLVPRLRFSILPKIIPPHQQKLSDFLLVHGMKCRNENFSLCICVSGATCTLGLFVNIL